MDNLNHTYYTYKDKHGFIRTKTYRIESIHDSDFNGELLRAGIQDKFPAGNVSFSRAVFKCPQQVRRYLSGEQLPPLDMFKRICLLLQIDPISLLNMRVIEVVDNDNDSRD